MEPSNWPDVLIGMILNTALLASVLAVVVSRTTYAYFAAKGGARVYADSSLVHTLLTATVVPLTFALVVGAFHGWWWGLAVAVASYALRLDVIVEYRTGRRERGSGKRTRTSPSGRLQHSADTAAVAAPLLAGVVLPVIALAGAVDGRCRQPGRRANPPRFPGASTSSRPGRTNCRPDALTRGIQFRTCAGWLCPAPRPAYRLVRVRQPRRSSGRFADPAVSCGPRLLTTAAKVRPTHQD
ncbi:hypothetical protein [Streptomyces sp. NBC_00893]|uniref:hypothetical protein n=1 Tax=Streptomyces sp. NBC_00893 TaxID=2975862 RepID=UPI0022506EC5|nr:hypothetical protein [Streptomyces sp. NBC_00893]MCX4850170.1 hypothetical protein [Streptomyces sp. NBC_00893]